MYSLEERMKAVDLYFKYGGSSAAVRRELGYPSKRALKLWVGEYKSTGLLHEKYCGVRRPKYSEEQKQAAVDYYLEHGRSLRRSIDALGYPNRETLRQWLNEAIPDRRGLRGRRSFLPKVESLKQQVDTLEKQIHRLELERDVMEVTAEIRKKDPGADPKKLTNREKATAIGALRKRYPLNELLECFAMPKSSYFYNQAVMSMPDKYSELRERVRAAFTQADGRYGYRRVHAALTRDEGVVSEKLIRRLMREEGLMVVGRKKRKYSSYVGEISPPVPNSIERNFHADAPNTKWLTDLTEFPLPAGKVYLSPVVDCFDGMAVSWSIGTSPDAGMVNLMLESAMATLGEGDHPVVRYPVDYGAAEPPIRKSEGHPSGIAEPPFRY